MKLFVKILVPTVIVLLIVAVFGLGYRLGVFIGPSGTADQQPADEQSASAEQFWTCSMHPQVRKSKPGLCDFCPMELIPVSSDQGGKLGPRQLKLSAQAALLARVQLAPVERKFVTAEIRMVGKIAYDETRLAYISAWVPGRIDRLYADYTGISVGPGEHLAEFYSPQLLTTQQELIQALKILKQSDQQSSLQTIRQTAQLTVDAVRERLRLWGLTQKQIAEIEKQGQPSDHMTIYAPISGIVVEKHVKQGQYVETGSRIFTIADLSKVWVMLEAYESDIAWIRYGQQVEFETESYPGKKFTGKIAFVDQVLNSRTRTVRLRVNVDNAHGKLKPEMFVRAVVRARLTEDGKVLAPDLAGKWISPMHPEVIKDSPGLCDVCGMPLVRAETLGYAGAETGSSQAPLVIPTTAALLTGKRAVVYVADPDEQGLYQGREITLGPRAGDYYIVRDGLTEGEMVVAQGNFKIDSAVQILGKTSMMNPDSQAHPAEKTSAAVSFKPEIVGPLAEQLGKIFTDYFEIQYALSHDDFDRSIQGCEKLLQSVAQIEPTQLSDRAWQVWQKETDDINKTTTRMRTAVNIERIRREFVMLSESMLMVARRFGSGTSKTVLRMHCPMAFDNRGADWLQNKSAVENPYYGAVMFSCGSEVENLTKAENKNP